MHTHTYIHTRICARASGTHHSKGLSGGSYNIVKTRGHKLSKYEYAHGLLYSIYFIANFIPRVRTRRCGPYRIIQWLRCAFARVIFMFHVIVYTHKSRLTNYAHAVNIKHRWRVRLLAAAIHLRAPTPRNGRAPHYPLYVWLRDILISFDRENRKRSKSPNHKRLKFVFAVFMTRFFFLPFILYVCFILSKFR